MMRRIAPGAEFTGWLGRDGVRERLRGARALVLPSRWYEASPLVVPEAAALGIPAIVADRCAAKLSIIDGVSGLTFRSGDIVDLAEKLKILSNRRLAAVMGKAAYDNFWADPPLMQRHLGALRDVYETILGERDA
jgi:glycosyltransferase involved in cell wall biosynthesis